jgi:hypothetical protein
MKNNQVNILTIALNNLSLYQTLRSTLYNSHILSWKMCVFLNFKEGLQNIKASQQCHVPYKDEIAENRGMIKEEHLFMQ